MDLNHFRELNRCTGNGYSVFPTKYASKIPALRGWAEFNKRRADQTEIQGWFDTLGDCGTTLAGGSRFGYLVIDCDILDPELAEKARLELESLIGGPFPYRIGRAPKWAALVGCNRAWPSRKIHPVELFGTSGHTLAFGIHPDTQSPYEWFNGSPDQSPVSELPKVDERILTRFLLFVDRLLEREKTPKGRKSSSGGKSQRGLSLTRSKLSLERDGKRGTDYGQTIKDQLERMDDGNRSDTLISVVSSLLSRGFSKTQIIAICDGSYLQRWEGDERHGLRLLEEMIDRVSENIRGGMWKS